MRRWTYLLPLVLVLSCGPRQNNSQKAAPVSTRDFPQVEVPAMVQDGLERGAYVALHYWDAFTAPEKLYACDSLTVNGVPLQKLEENVGLFASVLDLLPQADGEAAMDACYKHLAAFQAAQPQGNVFPKTVELLSRYFYDPNSPLRNEDLYLPFVKELATSPHVEASRRPGYEWDARMCAKNRTGTQATDFEFIDTAGKRRSLYSVKAQVLLLIFGNPDCQACKDIVAAMEGSPLVSDLLESGYLKVVDVFIDEEIDLWKQRAASYPKAWINGYDPAGAIRTDLLYSVRAVPSLYLLDSDKKVILKDATPEKVFAVLEAV